MDKEAAPGTTAFPLPGKRQSKHDKTLTLFSLDGWQRIVHWLILNSSLYIWNIYDENSAFMGSLREGVLHLHIYFYKGFICP